MQAPHAAAAAERAEGANAVVDAAVNPTLGPNPSAVRELYNLYAPAYELITRATGYIGPAWLDAALAATVQAGAAAGLPAPQHVVDLACGNGLLASVVLQHAPQAQLTGLDLAEGMLVQARTTGLYGQLLQHDLNLLPWPLPQGQTQWVLALGFVEFLRQPAAFFAAVCQLLAPGGRLWVSVREHRPGDPQNYPRQAFTGGVLHQAYTQSEVTTMLTDAGLVITQLEALVGYRPDAHTDCPFLMVQAHRPLATHTTA
jgi:predicted TPR repeat methyltransferase